MGAAGPPRAAQIAPAFAHLIHRPQIVDHAGITGRIGKNGRPAASGKLGRKRPIFPGRPVFRSWRLVTDSLDQKGQHAPLAGVVVGRAKSRLTHARKRPSESGIKAAPNSETIKAR